MKIENFNCKSKIGKLKKKQPNDFRPKKYRVTFFFIQFKISRSLTRCA